MKTQSANPTKPFVSVGLEHDHLSMRGVRISHDGKGGHVIKNMEEIHGDFSSHEEVAEGFRILKGKLGISQKDRLVTCLAGKQIYASQIPFRNLPQDEMAQALNLELRKSVPFETSGGTLDYRILSEAGEKGEQVQVLVALAGAGILKMHLKALETAGLHPLVVDILPIAVANSLWLWNESATNEHPKVAVHIGPQISTIVLDGAKHPFFNRYIYFAAEEVLGGGRQASQVETGIRILADEISRTIAFYEKSERTSGIQEIVLLGEYLGDNSLGNTIANTTGLQVRKMDLPKKLGHAHDFQVGRFDVATSLAFKGN